MNPEQYGFDSFYAMAIQNEVDETDFNFFFAYNLWNYFPVPKSLHQGNELVHKNG